MDPTLANVLNVVEGAVILEIMELKSDVRNVKELVVHQKAFAKVVKVLVYCVRSFRRK